MKFKINNRSWEILEVSQAEIKTMQNERKANDEEDIKSIASRYYGVTYCDICKIYIDKDLPIDRKKATLIHELTHCFIDNYITHDEKQYSEEDVADLVSNSFDFINEVVEKYKNNKQVCRVENKSWEELSDYEKELIMERIKKQPLQIT